MPDHCIPKCEENSSIFNLMPWTITAKSPRMIFKLCPIKNTQADKKPKKIKLEIEVKNLKEFKQALNTEPDIIMLDNMKISDIKKAVMIKCNTQYAIRNTLLEASGNINLKNIRAYAQTGVDVISLGTLTKDIYCIDLSLEIREGG